MVLPPPPPRSSASALERHTIDVVCYKALQRVASSVCTDHDGDDNDSAENDVGNADGDDVVDNRNKEDSDQDTASSVITQHAAPTAAAAVVIEVLRPRHIAELCAMRMSFRSWTRILHRKRTAADGGGGVNAAFDRLLVKLEQFGRLVDVLLEMLLLPARHQENGHLPALLDELRELASATLNTMQAVPSPLSTSTVSVNVHLVSVERMWMDKYVNSPCLLMCMALLWMERGLYRYAIHYLAMLSQTLNPAQMALDRDICVSQDIQIDSIAEYVSSSSSSSSSL